MHIKKYEINYLKKIITILNSSLIRYGYFIIINLITNTSFSQNLVAYYPFDNSVLDKSNYANNGLIHGNVTSTMDRFGNPCGSMYFDGKSGYIEVPSSPSLESPSKEFSVAVWYKLNRNQAANYWLTVICKGSTSSEIQNPQYRLQVQQNFSGPINICKTGTAGSSTISLCTEFTKCDNDFQQHLFVPDKWCFYAITYDGTIVRTYLNGKNIFSYSTSLQFIKNQSPLYIGLDEPGVTEYFEGALDDLRIYNKALTVSEISNLFSEIKNQPQNGEEFELEMKNNEIVYLTKNNCSAKVNYYPPKLTERCGNVSLTQISGLPSGTGFNCGTNVITYEAKSKSGYTQRSTFNIIVKDTIRPSLLTPKDTTILISKNTKGILYNYASPKANDNCKIKSIDLIAGLKTGSFFPVGNNSITFSATDIYGNRTNKTFFVTIKEKSDKGSTNQVYSPTLKKIDTITSSIRTIPLNTSPKIDSTPFINIPNVANTNDTTDIPQIFKLREIKRQEFIEVDSPKLRVELYDNAEIDGDSVSLFLNHTMLVSNQLLGLKPVIVLISIDSTIDNELTLFAENEGSIPPNTALLVLWDGSKRHEINLTSTLKSNGTLIIRRKKVK